MGNKVTILGIVHQDPLGRARIKSYLQNLKKQNITPDLFAVEWKEEIASDLISARGEFKEHLKLNIPDLSDSTLEAFSLAVAYEADASDEVFEGTQKLWLDEDRKDKKEKSFTVPGFLAQRGFYYLGIYYESSVAEMNDLARVSAITWKQLDNDRWKPKKRDEIFARLVIAAIADGYENIIAIVGASHAIVENKGSFADILSKQELSLETVLLR